MTTVYTPQLSFGSGAQRYLFPVTFQEISRTVTLAFDKKKIPFNYGEDVDRNTGASARDIVISGPVGSLIQGSVSQQTNAGIQLASAADLEAERRLLGGLQLLGRQALYVGPNQYIFAYLESFEHKFWQDAYGMRYADWTLKFYADDPRYYSVSPTLVGSSTPITVSTIQSVSATTTGNVRAYPTCTFTASGGTLSQPYIGIQRSAANGSGLIQVRFSLLNGVNAMVAGSTLVIECDPRPNKRSVCAVYTAPGKQPVNALMYLNVANADFTNSYDLSEFFPFIEPPQVETGLTLFYGAITTGSYTFTAQWNDRWL